MIESELLHPQWLKILFFSLLAVAICNGLVASFSSAYYKNFAVGRLTHSQLRIKQGTANLDQRLNVFILAIIFSVTSFRLLIVSLVLAVSINFLFIFMLPAA